MTKRKSLSNFYSQVVNLLQSARTDVIRTINHRIVLTYFEIGRMIVEEEQNGKERAEYGKELLKGLSTFLSKEFGKGFSVDNLENMRKFYQAYKNSETVSRISSYENSDTMFRIFNLSWSHYFKIMRIEDKNEGKFYEIESQKNNWSVKILT